MKAQKLFSHKTTYTLAPYYSEIKEEFPYKASFICPEIPHHTNEDKLNPACKLNKCNGQSCLKFVFFSKT